MPIGVTCPNCKSAMTVGDEWSGRRARCPTCGKPLTVPILETPVALPESFTPVLKIVPRETTPPAAPPTNPKLRSCKDCGGQVSKSARACPHCGAKIVSLGQSMMALGCLLWLLPIIIVGVVIFLISIFGLVSR